MKGKQLVMLLHRQLIGTSDIQAFNLIGSIFWEFEREKEQEYNCHKMIQHEHFVCTFRLSSKFSELITRSLSSKPRAAKAPLVSQDTMAYAGYHHTVLLRSDGQAVVCGRNSVGQCNIPRLGEGLSYSQVSAGGGHTVLLRSDGQAVGQCSIPPLGEGLSYSQVSAGGGHTVLLRSDGQAVACGKTSDGQCSIPPLDEGISYSQVSAGYYHTVLLRSDGQAVACGKTSDGRCSIQRMKDFHTARFLQEGFTQCFSEVMVKL